MLQTPIQPAVGTNIDVMGLAKGTAAHITRMKPRALTG